MIAAAFGPLIGGIATPAGTAANLVAIAQLKQLAGVEVSFLRWMAYGVPASLLMIPLAWRLLLWLYPPELERLPIQDDEVRERLDALGPLNPIERRTLWIFVAVIAVWLFGPLLAAWTRWPLRPAGRGGGPGRRAEPVHAGHPRDDLEGSRARDRLGRDHADRRGAVARPGGVRGRCGALARLGAARSDHGDPGSPEARGDRAGGCRACT